MFILGPYPRLIKPEPLGMKISIFKSSPDDYILLPALRIDLHVPQTHNDKFKNASRVYIELCHLNKMLNTQARRYSLRICDTEVPNTSGHCVHWLHVSGYLRMEAEEEGWIKYFSYSLFLWGRCGGVWSKYGKISNSNISRGKMEALLCSL